MKKQQRRIVENLPQNLLKPFQSPPQTFPKRFQNRPKPFQNPSQTLPEASPNPPQTLPKPSPKPPVITNWRPNGPVSIMEQQFGPTWLQFHVLRTYRRAAGEKRKAKVNANEWVHA